MARNMITGIETQKMQEYTQEQIDRAEHMGIAIPADVKEQIFEYANLVGEEEKVRTLVRNLADAVNRSDEDRVEELLDDAQMDIQDLPDPTIGKLELRIMDIQQKIWCHLEKKQPWIITEWVLKSIAWVVMAARESMQVKK